MKESKFIELLNLYVDGEIDQADAAVLETEIQRNPDRRRIYGEYCRMQKACTMLALKSLAEGSPEEAIHTAAQPRRSPVFAVFAYGSGLAAAACVTFLAITYTHRAPGLPEGVPSSVGVPMPELMASTPVAPERVRVPLVSTGVYQMASLAPSELRLSRNLPTPQTVFVRDDSEQFAWMNAVQFKPVNTVSGDEPVFQERSLQQDNRVFRGPRSIQPVEMTAFQFQR